MSSPNEIASRMLANLSISEPELDLGVGTPMRKILDTVAEAIAETQIDNYLISYQYDIDSRSGADLDAFVALFGFYRIPAQIGSGTILLQRRTAATASILVPSGSQAGTSGVSPRLVRTSTPAIFEKGSVSVEVPAVSVIGGSAGNIAAGLIDRWLGTSEGVSSVTNPSPFIGGDDAESDEELRDRFKRTVFRNLAGTKDMYLALGLADTSTNAAIVHGANAHNEEQIQTIGGTATSSITTLNSYDQPIPISTATNASPSVITTLNPHWLSNGNLVSIAGAAGNTAINGFRRVLTVLSSRTFTVSDAFTDVPVAGNGVYSGTVGTVIAVKRFAGIIPQMLIAFGNDIDNNDIFPTSMYTLSTTTAPPVLTVLDTQTIPDAIYELSYHYVSQGSRNRPFATAGRISDRIDLWVDGEHAAEASISVVVDSAVKIAADSSLYSYGGLRREDNIRPTIGNVYCPLTLSPVLALPSTIQLGNDTLAINVDYWLLYNMVVDKTGTMEYPDAIEFNPTGGIEARTINITSSTNASPIVLTIGAHSFFVGQRVRVAGHLVNTNANGDRYISAVSATTITLTGSVGNGVGAATGTVKLYHPLTLKYTFNDTPLRIQRAAEQWRMATSDLVVHKALALPLRIYMAVILLPGYTEVSVRPSIENTISAMLTDIGIGQILQISDLLRVVSNVSGVDAVRMLNSTDVTNYTITAATLATPIVLTTSANHGYAVGDLVIVRSVGGNTAANGVYSLSAVTANTMTLLDSAGNAAYTSGGAVVRADFAINIVAANGVRRRGVEADLDVAPYRPTDVFANDNEHFVLHSLVLSVRAQNAFGNL
jgi:uncharacterized phage protein gp47/JayE